MGIEILYTRTNNVLWTEEWVRVVSRDIIIVAFKSHITIEILYTQTSYVICYRTHAHLGAGRRG